MYSKFCHVQQKQFFHVATQSTILHYFYRLKDRIPSDCINKDKILMLQKLNSLYQGNEENGIDTNTENGRVTNTKNGRDTCTYTKNERDMNTENETDTNTELKTLAGKYIPLLNFFAYQLVLSADNFCKQFGPRSGPTKCRAWSVSKLFDTLMVFLKEFFFEKSWYRWQKSMQIIPVGKELNTYIPFVVSKSF